MGLRSSAYICQRITNAIVFIFYQMGYGILNYLDDFAGAETEQLAKRAFEKLGCLLEACGLEESKEKAIAPTTRMPFLGVDCDTVKLTLEVTPDRVIEILELVESWLKRVTATVREIQSLLGKLQFISSCVRPGRIFVSRLLTWLRTIHSSTQREKIPTFVKKDIVWWSKFLPTYNGISMMALENWSEVDEIIACDACLEGCGGFGLEEYFHSAFPPTIKRKGLHINALELLTIVVALSLCGYKLKGKRIRVLCDNQSSV